MYCKFCGKQIDDDSVFCVHCGKNLTENNKENSEKQNYESNELSQSITTEDEESSSRWWVWLALPIFLLILIAIIGAASSNGPGLIQRDLKTSDYTYTTSHDLTSYRITVIPNRDIDNCDIQLTLYSSKGEKLFSDTISKSNLKEGNSYTYLFDFGFVNSLSGNRVKYNITGKCKQQYNK